jgi:hypothetical protein
MIEVVAYRPEPQPHLGDVAVAVAVATVRNGLRAGAVVVGVVRPFAELVPVPVVIPGRRLQELAETGFAQRQWAKSELIQLFHRILQRIITDVLNQIDLTALVRDRVDLNAVTQNLDLDAIVSRLDIDGIVSRVDIDGIVEQIDLDAIVSRIDIDGIVSRVDLDGIVSRLDIDGIVSRVDIDGIVERVDIDGIVKRLDLAGLARYVVTEIDLPEIIRQSSTSVATETVQDVRIRSIEADQLVSRIVDRAVHLWRVPPRQRGATPDGRPHDVIEGSPPREIDEQADGSPPSGEVVERPVPEKRDHDGRA